MQVRFGALGLLQQGYADETYPMRMRYCHSYTLESRQEVAKNLKEQHPACDYMVYQSKKDHEQGEILIGTQQDAHNIRQIRRLEGFLSDLSHRSMLMYGLPEELTQPLTFTVRQPVVVKLPICPPQPKGFMARLFNRFRKPPKPIEYKYETRYWDNQLVFDVKAALKKLANEPDKTMQDAFYEFWKSQLDTEVYFDVYKAALENKLILTGERYFTIPDYPVPVDTEEDRLRKRGFDWGLIKASKTSVDTSAFMQTFTRVVENLTNAGHLKLFKLDNAEC